MGVARGEGLVYVVGSGSAMVGVVPESSRLRPDGLLAVMVTRMLWWTGREYGYENQSRWRCRPVDFACHD